MSEQTEKRHHRRLTVLLETNWEGLSGRNLSARVSDISLSGCFIETPAQYTSGAVINFAIQTPSGKLLHLQGEVAYATPGIGFGVRFVALGEQERELVGLLIECAP